MAAHLIMAILTGLAHGHHHHHILQAPFCTVSRQGLATCIGFGLR